MNKYVVANWKQNKDLKEVDLWLRSFGDLVQEGLKNAAVIISPPFPYLYKNHLTEQKNIFTAAQDVSQTENGAHTGEVGATQLKDYCDFCIVGHSERSEKIDVVLEKRDVCLENGITPIVCFIDPDVIGKFYREGILLAWEDPTNISKNGVFNPKSSGDIAEIMVELKSMLPQDTKVLYGGSVNRQNATDLAKIPELDGVLVGSASLDPQHFLEIVKAFDI